MVGKLACNVRVSSRKATSYDPERTVRVRETDTHGFLTVKGLTVGLSRDEFEYEIPKDEGHTAKMRAHPPIQKRRYFVEYEGHLWEVDIFEGATEGLEVAEIELRREDEEFVRTEWLGEEAEDRRYSNSSLSLFYKYW